MRTAYHTLVIGSGCAGYSAAAKLWDLGIRDLAILTEGRLMGTSRNTGSDKQTYYKLSLCGDEGDSVREMAHTLYSGGGVMGEHALCEAAYSTRCFMRLVELGVPFPTNEYGEYAGYKTDHDPRARATSCGPLTSRYMTEALEAACAARGVEILDGLLGVELLHDGTRIRGVACVSTVTGEYTILSCESVILCTGGPAGIYRDSVYPESQHGATGLAISAGVSLSNMEEWQYGLASTAFRWNLSGTYQQVLPRYVSVDGAGVEREFLWDALGEASLGLIFLKGYQWPFDTRKLEGSSRVDLLVAAQRKAGRRVYLDFTRNPRGLEQGFSVLPAEAHDYLARSGALFGTPIERLAHMNRGAIELYADHGIDLYGERLEISVCAQHCNGGITVDSHWQTSLAGVYAAGEAAGTFGVYRPGGSALNSTQVGSLRAAEHIASRGAGQGGHPDGGPSVAAAVPAALTYTPPAFRMGESNLASLRDSLRAEMSRVADFDRDTAGMAALYDRVTALLGDFWNTVTLAHPAEAAEAHRLYDQLLTQQATLSAMLCSAEALGSHGSALVDKRPPAAEDAPRTTRTLTVNGVSRMEPVSPPPDPELWFETLLARAREKRPIPPMNGQA